MYYTRAIGTVNEVYESTTEFRSTDISFDYLIVQVDAAAAAPTPTPEPAP